MKPVLIGMNNPHSDNPERALGTRPTNASGYRLWHMLAISALYREPPKVIESWDYVAVFDRYNLLDYEVFDPTRFTEERHNYIMEKINQRIVVMCGTNVPRTLGYKHKGFDLNPYTAHSPVPFTYYVIPHPSGMCREYNDVGMRTRVGNLLLSLYLDGKAA